MSAAIERGELPESRAACLACKWGGQVRELVGYEYELEGSEETLLVKFIQELKAALASSFTAVGHALLKYGYIDERESMAEIRRKSIRYSMGIVLGAADGVNRARIELERERVEMERARHERQKKVVS